MQITEGICVNHIWSLTDKDISLYWLPCSWCVIFSTNLVHYTPIRDKKQHSLELLILAYDLLATEDTTDKLEFSRNEVIILFIKDTYHQN